jgi:hypothetical protein
MNDIEFPHAIYESSSDEHIGRVIDTGHGYDAQLYDVDDTNWWLVAHLRFDSLSAAVAAADNHVTR